MGIPGLSGFAAEITILLSAWKTFPVFFFQAEDGIRDLYVTGDQTCALPISPACSHGQRPSAAALPRHDDDRAVGVVYHMIADRAQQQPREPAPAPGAHHQQVSIARGLDEFLGGEAVHRPDSHRSGFGL